MNFTSHSILLSDGSTVGQDKILLADSKVWESIKKTIYLFLPPEIYDYKKMRVADLGCLEGAYSVEFAKMGFQTIGIEARQENIDKCNFLKSDLKLDNFSFFKDDVRNLHNYGKFDIILNYGLLYHLDTPVNFLKECFECNTKLLFLNTHFAPLVDIRYELGPVNKYFIGPVQKKTKLFEFTKNYRLSPLTQNEGYYGRWYREWNEKSSKNKIEKLRLASYNNYRSFWLLKTELTKSLHTIGYSHVFEQFDYKGDIMSDDYTEKYNRAMFVAIKD